MTLEQLRVFVCVAECEHMTRAAETLNLTQSATSAAIAALEERHGVKLFDRIGRRIALTGAGRAFLGEAKAVLARAATAEQTLADLAGLKTGALAIAASQTVGSYWLPRRIAAFHARYPGVAVALRIGNTDAVAELTRAGEVDLGFVEGEVDDPALDATAIDEDELLIVAAAGARDSLERPRRRAPRRGDMGRAREGLGHARRFRERAGGVRRRPGAPPHRARTAVERGDLRRGGGGGGTGGDVAAGGRRVDQGGRTRRRAARPAATALLPPAPSATLRIAGGARLLRRVDRRRLIVARRRAGYARMRSVQIITANSAAPIRTAIEPMIVGSSGPFITVK